MTRVEARRILEHYDDIVWQDAKGITCGKVKEAFDMALDSLKNPWHKASEELPKKGGFYLCTDYNKHIVQLAFCGTKWVNTSQFFTVDLCLVEYWMPIPELPKEEKK